MWVKYIMICVSGTLPIMALQPSAMVLFINNKKKLYIVVLSLELERNINTIQSGKRSKWLRRIEWTINIQRFTINLWYGLISPDFYWPFIDNNFSEFNISCLFVTFYTNHTYFLHIFIIYFSSWVRL